MVKRMKDESWQDESRGGQKGWFRIPLVVRDAEGYLQGEPCDEAVEGVDGDTVGGVTISEAELDGGYDKEEHEGDR